MPWGEHEAPSLILANGGKNFLTPGSLHGQILLQLMILRPLESHFDPWVPTAINLQWLVEMPRDGPLRQHHGTMQSRRRDGGIGPLAAGRTLSSLMTHAPQPPLPARSQCLHEVQLLFSVA